MGPGSKADSVTFSGTDSGIISELHRHCPLSGHRSATRSLSLTSGAVISAGSPASTVTTEGRHGRSDSAMISGGSRHLESGLRCGRGPDDNICERVDPGQWTIRRAPSAAVTPADHHHPDGQLDQLSNGSSITARPRTAARRQVVPHDGHAEPGQRQHHSPHNSSDVGTITANVALI